MKLFLTDQANRFVQHLEKLKRTPLMVFDRHTLVERVSSIEINQPFDNIDPAFLFDYKIFPSNILTFHTQWNTEGRSMQLGDTVLQQACVPPVRSLSVKIIFGVRISSIIREEKRIGFSYQTLEGHGERGKSFFTLEEKPEGVIFRIHTFSEPGNIVSKLVSSIFTIPYQAYCTRKALQHVKVQIEQQKITSRPLSPQI